MKLRTRKKSVLDNIKQEDCKPSTLTNTHSTTVTATNSNNTFDLTIKQEETKEHKSLSKQDGDIDKEEYHYQCDLCKMKVANLTSVLKHRISIHGIRQSSIRLIKNLDEEPNVHDPNFYCKSCEKGYNNTHKYRNHLRQAHYMILKPILRKSPKDVIDPDSNDSGFYCRACDFTYKRKANYRNHCRYAHGLKLTDFANRKSTTNSLTDSYCQACDRRLATIDSYRRHLFAIHKIDIRKMEQKPSDIMPNVNDPNFYCRSCEKTLAHKGSFRRHLKQMHSIHQSAPNKSRLQPDIDNSNNYCRACRKTYTSKGRYREHLRMVHQMTLVPLQGNVNREQLPDPYNPDYYCSVCKKTYASVRNYRMHCKGVHLMELEHYAIVNPSAEINVNDRKLYCAQCEHSYNSKQTFKNHLRNIHGIEFLSLQS